MKHLFQPGAAHPNWKGGRTTNNGYITIRQGPGAGNVKREHRIVAERILGRPLLAREVVHHKNGIKTDNRPENLEVFSSSGEHGHLRHSVPIGLRKQTHCKRGHSLRDAYINKLNRRECRECRRIRGRAWATQHPERIKDRHIKSRTERRHALYELKEVPK